MTKWQKWKMRVFHWEFWPFWFFYLPVFVWYAILSLRERSFFYFSAANPNMDMGGMMGASKSQIFNDIPHQYLPETILITAEKRDTLDQLSAEIGFPLVAKPDAGERGRGVEKINSLNELMQYASDMPYNFLLQEMVWYPVELGVFYVRHPSWQNGSVTSVVRKDFLKVVGDGVHTLSQLLNLNERASLQFDKTSLSDQELTVVPIKGREIIVEHIGNHRRGTAFLDATAEADAALTEAIDTLSKQIPNFFYGRFDLKCASIDDLRNLKNFKILELNGAASEPAHIYQPGFSLFKAYRIVFWHHLMLANISRANRRNGFSYLSHREGMKRARAFFAKQKTAN